MDVNQLRCFVAVGKELHFGRAAQRMEMMPASLSRFIRLLEDELGVRLLNRSTRNVALTADGALFFDEASKLIEQFDVLMHRFKNGLHNSRRTLRIGAIDSAARGIVPDLLNMYVKTHPMSDIHIIEDKTINLIPKLKSGWLDLIFFRPSSVSDESLSVKFLMLENYVLAVPRDHRLGNHTSVSIKDLVDEPMIIPDRRTRPHSHELTMSLFKYSGLSPHISQVAEEKQTILSLVAAGLGLAIVPSAYRNMNNENVIYIDIEANEKIKGLPLSVAWQKGNPDEDLSDILSLLSENKGVLISKM